MASLKIYAPVLILLSVFAAGISTLPSVPDGNTDIFARCVVCHTENTDDIKTGPHNLMQCTECHVISDFTDSRHNSTIPGCESCHEGIYKGTNHHKFEYFPKPYFLYNPNVTYSEYATYVTAFEPSNNSLK